MDTHQRKARVALLSVGSNTALILVKVVVGVLTGSVSVLSEAIHSGVDLLAALIAWMAVRTSGRDADEEHPFGHGKIENISGTVEALLIFGAAGWIIYEAAHRLLHPRPMGEALLGVGVMLLSAAVNIVVSQALFRVGRATGSVALEADAWHLRTDVYTSAGVMVGLSVVAVGKAVAPQTDLHWVDPAAALAVALLIVKAAYDLTRSAARDLLDASLPAEEVAAIRGIIEKHLPCAAGCHGLATRRAGAQRFVTFHLLVDPSLTTERSHGLAEAITAEVEAAFARCEVTVHVEPCSRECGPAWESEGCPARE